MAPPKKRATREPVVALNQHPKDWIYEPSRLGRTVELMRSVTTENLQSAEDFWSTGSLGGDAGGDTTIPAGDAAGENTQVFDKTSLSTPGKDGEIFLSHIWEPPENWERFFPSSTYEAVKKLQVDSTTKRLAKRRLQSSSKFRELRLWVDRASVPSEVHPEDHPLFKTSFGEEGLSKSTLKPYRMPTKELKQILFKEDTKIYSTVRKEEPHGFEGILRIRERDIFGTPKTNPTDVSVKWEIPPGQYTVQKVCVTEQDGVPHMDYSVYQIVRDGPLKKWLFGNKLRDDIWLEVTFGSCRCENLKMVETILALNELYVAVMPWNYFDRLWALYEWSIFCVVHGLGRMHLAVDIFLQGSAGDTSSQHLEYRRMLRRLSVVNAKCQDKRDADFLWQKIQYFFQCDAIIDTTYKVPMGDVLTGDVLLRKTRMVDFSKFERYVRAGTIAAFAREMALTKANSPEKEKTEDSYMPWMDLAKEFGFTDLFNALKKWRPYKMCRTCGEDEARYVREVEEWFASEVLPVMDDEAALAVRPFILDQQQRTIRPPNDTKLVNPFH